ncbi:hypothetical protein JXA70_04015 [candidate division KSB1 bacterium]|nr:hypothetical protein [candidate division KSB1 bacterium]
MTDRRGFLKSGVRLLLLTVIGLGVVFGLRKKKIIIRATAACAGNSGCQECEKRAACQNERAYRYKIESGRMRGESSKQNIDK